MSRSQHGIRFRYRVINPQAWIKAEELICSPLLRHLFLLLFVQTSTLFNAEKNRSLACRQNRCKTPLGWVEHREMHAHAVSYAFTLTDAHMRTHREKQKGRWQTGRKIDTGSTWAFFCQAEQRRCLFDSLYIVYCNYTLQHVNAVIKYIVCMQIT